ncbi:7-carboxy-7-deazaguanine synthase [Ruegeria sp. HKCCSP335]|uniref:7-carboxy-7-deazaguanine synthase n=1 Tax=Ruegeria sp. HKCCSP335 TaxID=2794833 RepID=UPI001AE21265|nr:7-carboxy-7-deazaguanine synthase [Ruegeria sp. HKCCSP335]
MTYSVKEVFYTLQGEGANTGRPAVFCRFSGCNLWSGLERDRSTAICQFCDTDFVGTDGIGGGKFRTAEELADHVASTWPVSCGGKKLVVCTGGEPALQLDTALVDALHTRGFEVAIETNGTLPLPEGIDWVCVSPKAGTEIVVKKGNELKAVYPQPGLDLKFLRGLDFTHFFLQAMDGADQQQALAQVLNYCLEHPEWRLSLQTHKILEIA